MRRATEAFALPPDALPCPVGVERATAQEEWRLPGPATDLLGIDRRTRRRTPGMPRLDGPSGGLHTNLEARLILACTFGWAWVDALAIAPTGLLVRAPERSLAPSDSDERALWTTLARRSGSTLAWVGSCVLSQSVVGELGNAANPPDARTIRETEVLLLGMPRRRGGAVVEVAGRVTPLTDPDPRTLAIALGEADHRRFVRDVRWVGTRTGAPRVTGVHSHVWSSGTASARCLKRHE